MRVGSFASRFVAFALLLVAILAAFQLIIAPVLTDHRDLGLKIELSQELLYRYRELSARRAQLEARHEAVEKRATETVAYFRASSDTIGGAGLQIHVQNIVERAGGEVQSSEILPVESMKLKVVRRVALKVKLLIDIARLQDIIYDLESAQPFVFIMELSVYGMAESRQTSDAGNKPMLEVTLQVYGFMCAPSATGPTELPTISPLATESNLSSTVRFTK